jgi:hypothetical protein
VALTRSVTLAILEGLSNFHKINDVRNLEGLSNFNEICDIGNLEGLCQLLQDM